SPSGVVLLHDTNIRQPNFGVWRFWAEIKEQYPHMEFLHGCGLGVLATGKRLPDGVAKWLDECQEPGYLSRVREFFSQIGQRFSLASQVHDGQRAVRQLAEKEQLVLGLQTRLKDLEEVQQQLQVAAERLAQMTAERDQANERFLALEKQLAQSQ